ncbi:hypothetical protein PAXRUDRAFT_29218 [Paxillus rubicundulus Ve08.2h10]|uniref:Uncharacterized protein n=1 Tax=Paxillus rubicundulus Ve08.2h10 TaxID=930991 RepID=A0A0D0CSI0_9AGAM|nr:hypothetical protein PAXRUDRAFT_29218 [Paxillus rubicundulus Ve08.2h10]
MPSARQPSAAKNKAALLRAAIAGGVAKSEPSEAVRDLADDEPVIALQGYALMSWLHGPDVSADNQRRASLPGEGHFEQPERLHVSRCYPKLPLTSRQEAGIPVSRFLSRGFAWADPSKFGFNGYALRLYDKALWPLAIVTLTLGTRVDRYMHASVGLNLKAKYEQASEITKHYIQLHTADVIITIGHNKLEASKLDATVEFLHSTSEAGCPANVAIVLQTDCHLVTGAMQYGERDGALAYTTVLDLLHAFLGEALLSTLDLIKISKHTPRASPMPKKPPALWALFLCTRGPTVRSLKHFLELRSLVDNLVMEAAIHRHTENITEAITFAGADNVTFAESTGIIMAYQGTNICVHCDVMAKHQLPFTPFGLTLRVCGPGLLSCMEEEGRFKVLCAMCGWESQSVTKEKLMESITEVRNSVYQHAYPTPFKLQTIFN